jgi:Uma2 family endonuclease
MATVQQSTKLMTIEEYSKLPESNVPTELVRGRVVEMNVPKPTHGTVLVRAGRILDEFVEEHELGIVAGGDSGVVTERDPDTLRGADVAFFSYKRLPRNADLDEYLDVAPEIVLEVRSPSDRWAKILEKVAEYLNAGVLRVCVLDPRTKSIRVYRPDEPEQILSADDELTLPEMHVDFRHPVSRFFPDIKKKPRRGKS